MNKKWLINSLYILAVVLLLVDIVLRVASNTSEFLFWLALLIYAIAELIRYKYQKEQEVEESGEGAVRN